MDPTAKTDSEILAGLLTQHWWLMALRGLAALAFGVLAFVWPGITVLTLIILFSVYSFINGILQFVMAAKAPLGYPRFTHLVLPGLISVAAGFIAIILPGLTALALLIIIAAWSIVNGIMEIVAAVKLRKSVADEWLWFLAGVSSMVFGVLVLVWPSAGALAVIWWIGAWSVFFGAMLFALAFRMRHDQSVAPPGAVPA